jgi:hypothetical protein
VVKTGHWICDCRESEKAGLQTFRDILFGIAQSRETDKFAPLSGREKSKALFAEMRPRRNRNHDDYILPRLFCIFGKTIR